jgi:phospholipid/cholesterol/gamma-HCH transport system permease protein
MLREFGVVLTGIVLAGRTNSSFTAQIGTMKMRQEIDAMQTLGLKPMDVLVAPRVLAMLVMTPILTFVATLAGVAGGMAVAWASLDINPAVFLERMRNSVPIDQFWVGMSKSPVFGLIVALIACRQGLQVGGSVQSLGKATTTSVVQGIFAIIVLDALFAIFYMELGI